MDQACLAAEAVKVTADAEAGVCRQAGVRLCVAKDGSRESVAGGKPVVTGKKVASDGWICRRTAQLPNVL